MFRVLWVVLCLAPSMTFAQSDDQPPPGDYDEPHVTYVGEPPGIESPVPDQPARRPQPSANQTPPPNAAQKVRRISLSDARTDWIATVELFVTQNTVEGAWPVRDAKGNVWRLKLIAARGETVRERRPGLFAGLALFRTGAGHAHRLDVEFAVDFTGAEPTVIQYAIKKIDGRASRAD